MKKHSMPLVTLVLCLLVLSDNIQENLAIRLWGQSSSSEENDWDGRWFPFSPAVGVDSNPEVNIGTDLYDREHGVKMGIKDPSCDDGKTNLDLDWNLNPLNYTCFVFEDKLLYRPKSDVKPIFSVDHIPQDYSAPHKCMDQRIEYASIIPTFGTHRPLWAKYGEYTFLPRQRWIHNLEHGAVIMLYHPCADKNEVQILRNLVQNCLYRHIITPHNLLSSKRPLALVAWGRKMEMSKVSPELVLKFIKENALNGAEKTSRDGQYSFMLERRAKIVSDIDDNQVCKVYNFME